MVDDVHRAFGLMGCSVIADSDDVCKQKERPEISQLSSVICVHVGV